MLVFIPADRHPFTTRTIETLKPGSPTPALGEPSTQSSWKPYKVSEQAVYLSLINATIFLCIDLCVVNSYPCFRRRTKPSHDLIRISDSSLPAVISARCPYRGMRNSML